MRRWLRVGLGFLAATQLVVGLWALLLPARFFALEVVGMGMAYNKHLMLDYGAMTLASAVVLGAATINMGQWITRTALVMYLTWAVPHFFVHLTMLDHLAPSTAALLMVALGLAIALPAGLLALTEREPRLLDDSSGRI
ncbi:hypothetical protein SAMN05216215_100427 [Saccharopolyspora shandongensis]|uniref:Uncharacterized protein n=1 Tax=Saccharopolyspora shandongensis TaxID=418495 RepID=A0A1H2UPH9_9PSEU|nr:hypothetical protein [Saccharopolyspora shandongensis]SDW57449.1 hypothetical protein SAMN05216215_100427 [Saccharopolyspora shandongensis]